MLGLQFTGLATETPRGKDAFAITPMAIVPPRTFHVSWDYPSDRQTPDLVFNLYSSSDLSLPLKKWGLRTNIPGSLRSVVLTTDRTADFFVLTASNSTGESPYATR